jgi:hypothetical protein
MRATEIKGALRAMPASPLSVGISLAIGMLGLRGLWKLQHPLDVRGYLLQAGAFLTALLATLVGYYAPYSAGVVLFDAGVILMGAFLLVPDIIYYSLRSYDRRRARTRGPGTA